MNNIFWTYKELEDSKVAVMILSPKDSGFWKCFSANENIPYIIFSSIEEAKLFATEMNKPEYYEEYGANYNLKYVEVDTDEWYAIYDKWNDFVEMVKIYREEFFTPWYKKVMNKIKLFITF